MLKAIGESPTWRVTSKVHTWIYEQAVREGQVVVMVKARGERKATAMGVLREHGGHFMNYYGRFATEEVERWRGPEPKVPGLLRR